MKDDPGAKSGLCVLQERVLGGGFAAPHLVLGALSLPLGPVRTPSVLQLPVSPPCPVYVMSWACVTSQRIGQGCHWLHAPLVGAVEGGGTGFSFDPRLSSWSVTGLLG